MGTYVISDIHGCYNELMIMLKKIGFSDADRLILAGDYIDRGRDSYKMLKWIENCPANVWLVRGNHEEEFATYVDWMIQINQTGNIGTDFDSNQAAAALYKITKHFLKEETSISYFDMYGTIRNLLSASGVTINDLQKWAERIRRTPYYHDLTIGDRTCIVVHAGYAEKSEDIGTSFSSIEEFCLYAREEGYYLGGRRHGMVVAGHTPTVIKGRLTYNKGKVFRYYDKEKDCIFYDIDCGCVFRVMEPDARLACIRLEDEEIFYV